MGLFRLLIVGIICALFYSHEHPFPALIMVILIGTSEIADYLSKLADLKKKELHLKYGED